MVLVVSFEPVSCAIAGHALEHAARRLLLLSPPRRMCVPASARTWLRRHAREALELAWSDEAPSLFFDHLVSQLHVLELGLLGAGWLLLLWFVLARLRSGGR